MEENILMKILIFNILVIFSGCKTTHEKSEKYSGGSIEISTGRLLNLEEKLKEAQIIAKSHPDNWKAKNNLIVLYRIKGKAHKAIKIAREVLGKDPNNYIVLNNLAMVYYDLKNYKYALYLLKKSITLHNPPPGARVNLGLVYLRSGDIYAAEREFLNAIKAKRNFYPGIKNLALLYFSRGNYSLSKKFLKKVVDREDTENHRIMLAIALRNCGKYTEAYTEYTKILKSNPDNMVALFNSAVMDIEYFGRPELALKKLESLKNKIQRGTMDLQKEYCQKLERYIERARKHRNNTKDRA